MTFATEVCACARLVDWYVAVPDPQLALLVRTRVPTREPKFQIGLHSRIGVVFDTVTLLALGTGFSFDRVQVDRLGSWAVSFGTTFYGFPPPTALGEEYDYTPGAEVLGFVSLEREIRRDRVGFVIGPFQLAIGKPISGDLAGAWYAINYQASFGFGLSFGAPRPARSAPASSESVP